MRLLLRLFPLLCAFLFFGTGSSHALQAVRKAFSADARSGRTENAVRLTRARLGHQPTASALPDPASMAFEQAELPDLEEDDDESPTAATCAAASASLPSFRSTVAVQALSRPPTYRAFEKHFAFGATPRFLALRVFRI